MMISFDTEEYIPIKEAARILGISNISQIYRWIDYGWIHPIVPFRRATLVSVKELQKVKKEKAIDNP